MHIEILVEDQSGKILLETLVPKILGTAHSYRIHHYKGIGHLPKDLNPKSDPQKRILLKELPRLLRGYAKTPGTDAVVILVDADKRNCSDFLKKLNTLIDHKTSNIRILFRLAIEEMEAWYFGDWQAVKCAFPKAKQNRYYLQDTPCDTWEKLAEAIETKSLDKIKKAGWPSSGQIKCQWAKQIGPHMDINNNQSPSFNKFRDGILRITT